MTNPVLKAIFVPLYLLIFISLTIVLAVVCIVVSFFSARAGRYITDTLWGWAALGPGGVRVKVFGRENLPQTPGGFIIYANHSSTADIPTVALATGIQVSWVAKAQLAQIPFFGWALARVHMLVDRGGGADSARKMVEDAEKRLADGQTLAIFPEGTRNRGDDLVLPFKKGTFILAKHTGALIVPIAIKNARNLWPVGRLWPYPGTIRVKIGPPLTPIPNEKLTPLTARAQDALLALLADESW